MRPHRFRIGRVRGTAASLGAALFLALLCAAPASAAFGLNGFEVNFTGPNGESELQAGSHPYGLTTTFSVNTREDPELGPIPEESVKDLFIGQIPGLVGIPRAVPQCPTAEFLTQASGNDANGVPFPPEVTECPNSTAVGITTVTVGNGEAVGPFLAPVYNLEPSPGTAAKLGFVVQSVPVTVDLGVSESPPYDIVAKITNVSEVLEFYGAELTVWGNPSSPIHDKERARCYEGVGTCPAGISEVPFLTMPRSCRGPLPTTYAADSWSLPGTYLPNGTPNLLDPRWVSGEALSRDEVGNPAGMVNCGKLPFSPEITAKPTSHAAESSTGLDFSLDVSNEGLTNAKAEAAGADVEKAVVTLPEGMTANPSSANGLGVCTEAQVEGETSTSAPGKGCPDASKLGSLEVETPLLQQTIKGGLYLAEPYKNPFHSLLALYMVLKNEELGVSIKQPLKVEPDPKTGQLVTIAEGLPQIPFSHFRLHFREGPRSPLVTPPSCGSKQVKAMLYPSSGGPPVERTSAFEIVTGVDGSACPSGTPPFQPGFEAGSENNAAAAYSPFFLRLTRQDGEQELTRFSSVLPPGVTGKIAGLARCSQDAVEAAKSKSGAEELASPSCPASSRIGSTLAGAGVGSILTYVPGSLYLGGPYHGDPLSVVAITPAIAGPFDVGDVVVQEALTLNPLTAEVEVDGSGSDPIPHILEGIPLKLRDLRVYVDRPEFTLNPTNCEPEQARATLWGGGADPFTTADDAPVAKSSGYQAANCAVLPFKPKLSLSLKGGTHRGAHPALKAVLTPRPGDANLASISTVLPHSEFIDQNHINNPCTRVQFAENACPPGSVLGIARAWTPLLDEPLEGPVYFRSNGGERQLPDIVADVHGEGFHITQVGFVDSVNERIRTRFLSFPDAPVSRVVFELNGGKHGVIVNSANLCAKKRHVSLQLGGQNGRGVSSNPVLATSCKKSKGKKKRAR